MPSLNRNDPLSSGQQKFLQQLLTKHVVSDSVCKKMYKNICDSCDGGEIDMGESMENCIGRINASLVPGFGMEIRTIELPEIDFPENDSPDEAQLYLSKKKKTKARYHAVVNKNADEISKQWATCTKTSHEIAYMKLVLQRIAESEQNSSRMDKQRGLGSTGKMHKIDLINLKNELEDVHKQKITLHVAEKVILNCCEEGWLIPSFRTENGIDIEDDNIESDNTPRKRKSSEMLQIGPRSYMEIPEFLEKILAGGKASLPQFIHHRG